MDIKIKVCNIFVGDAVCLYNIEFQLETTEIQHQIVQTTYVWCVFKICVIISFTKLYRKFKYIL